MRISTPLLFRQGVDAIQQQQARLAKTQLQVATGQRILTPADDPLGAKRILDINELLALNDQYQRHGEAARRRLAVQESALEGVDNVLQRIRELAIQGHNGAYRASDRQALAVEIGERLEELLGLANSQDGNNEYLFAGDKVHTQPFVRVAGGVDYAGDDGRRRLPIAPGYSLALGDAGSAVFMTIANGNGTFVTEAAPSNVGTGVIDGGTVLQTTQWTGGDYTLVFDDPPDSFQLIDEAAGSSETRSFVSGEAIRLAGIQVTISGVPQAGDRFSLSPSAHQDMFRTVQNLIEAFHSSSDAGGGARLSNDINRALTDLDQALENTRRVRAGVGARLSAIDTARQANEDVALHLKQTLSEIQDLDYAEAITRLNQQLAGLQAAQQSFVRLQNLSLFNFL